MRLELTVIEAESTLSFIGVMARSPLLSTCLFIMRLKVRVCHNQEVLVATKVGDVGVGLHVIHPPCVIA
jgi:hypothetical protein